MFVRSAAETGTPRTRPRRPDGVRAGPRTWRAAHAPSRDSRRRARRCAGRSGARVRSTCSDVAGAVAPAQAVSPTASSTATARPTARLIGTRSPYRSARLLVGLEAVPHAGLGEEVARPGRLGLELLAQLREVEPQVAGVARVLRSPHARVSSVCCVTSRRGLRTQHLEDLPLGRRQPHRLRAPSRRTRDDASPRSTVTSPNRTTGLLRRAGAAAGERADAGEQLVGRERLGDVVVGARVERVDLVGRVRCGRRRRGSARWSSRGSPRSPRRRRARACRDRARRGRGALVATRSSASLPLRASDRPRSRGRAG